MAIVYLKVWLPAGADAAAQDSWAPLSPHPQPRDLAGGVTQVCPSRVSKAWPGIVWSETIMATTIQARQGCWVLRWALAGTHPALQHPQKPSLCVHTAGAPWEQTGTALSNSCHAGLVRETHESVLLCLCRSNKGLRVWQKSWNSLLEWTCVQIPTQSLTQPILSVIRSKLFNLSEPVFPHWWGGYLETELQEIKCLDPIKSLRKCLLSPWL